MIINIKRDELKKKKGRFDLDSIIPKSYNIVVNKDRIAYSILLIKKENIKEKKNGINK